MSKINWTRVLLGGLLAGLVFNVLEALASFITGAEFESAVAALGKTLPTSGGVMAYYVILGFVYGIAMVFIYAAIRPRFGPGPATAVLAGLIAWFMTGVLNALGYAPLDIFPVRLYML